MGDYGKEPSLDRLEEGVDATQEDLRRMRDAAMKSVGSVAGRNPARAETASAEMRHHLALRHAKERDAIGPSTLARKR